MSTDPGSHRLFLRSLATIGVLLALLVLCLSGVGVWLVNTPAGRDLALTQLRNHMPAPFRLDWKQAHGVLNGGLTLTDVTLIWGDNRVAIGSVHWLVAMHPWSRTIDVADFRLEGVEVERAEDHTPLTLPQWSDLWPSIDLPLRLEVHHLDIEHVLIHQSGKMPVSLDHIRGAFSLGPGDVRLHHVRVGNADFSGQIDGIYRPSLHQTSALVASIVRLAPPSGLPATLAVALRGSRAHLVVALAGDAPTRWQGLVVMRGLTAPTWTARLSGQHLLPAMYAQHANEPRSPPEQPLDLDLHGQGQAGAIQLQGKVSQGQQVLTLQPSRLQWHDSVLEINHLVLAFYQGTLRLQGRLDLADPSQPQGQLTAIAHSFKLPRAASRASMSIEQAQLQIAGSLRAWTLTGDARLLLAGQQSRLRWTLDGNQHHATCKQLTLQASQGQMTLHGDIAWQPRLQWSVDVALAQLDPGFVWPDWSGQLSGAFHSHGQQRPSADQGDFLHGYSLQLDQVQLDGQLRARPLHFRAAMHWDGSQGQAKLALQLGQSRLAAEASMANQLTVRVRSQHVELADFLSSASGSVEGTFMAHGSMTAPTVALALRGQQLGWKANKIGQLTVQGSMPWRGTGGHLALTAQALTAAAGFDQVQFQIDGALTQFTTQAQLSSASVRARLRAQLNSTSARWQGRLDTLEIQPSRGDRWQLATPLTFAASAKAWHVSPGCLRAAKGEFCLAADYPGAGITLNSHGVSLSLLNPWLPLQAGRPVTVRGQVELNAQLQPDATSQAWLGHVNLASLEGGIGLGQSAYAALAGNAHEGDVIRYDHLTIKLDLNPTKILAKLGIGFQGDGYVDATLTTGWSDDAPLQGQLYMYLARLYWLELLLPDWVNPTGTVAGHLSVHGARSTPQFEGKLDWRDFTVQLPVYGLSVRQGNGHLQAQPDGSIQLEGALQSGPGTVHIDGTLAWLDPADPTPITLHLAGQNVQVYNTSELNILADPDIRIALLHGTVQVRGQIQVPHASVNLERLDRTVSPSDDAVVMETATKAEPTSTASPFDLDVLLHLGTDVKMRGLGFKGSIGGDVEILAQPKREMLGNGQLDLLGRYKAYGQDLTVTQGLLRWNHNLITDPRINLRAERTIGDVKAGITVTGRAAYPHAEVWSDPAMSQSEALSYIVLGHGLATATSNESQQVDAASSALTAGGGLIASQLGSKLGLDDAGISQSSTLGGSVLGVGKFISPRLYVGYGVSVVGSGSVVNMKYLLKHGFDIEVESSSVETRSSINWRTER